MPEPKDLADDQVDDLAEALIRQVMARSGDSGLKFSRINRKRAKRDAILPTDGNINESCWQRAWEQVGNDPRIVRTRNNQFTAVYRRKIRMERLENPRGQQFDDIVNAVVRLVTDEGMIDVKLIWDKVGDAIEMVPVKHACARVMSAVYSRGVKKENGQLMLRPEGEIPPTRKSRKSSVKPVPEATTKCAASKPKVTALKPSLEVPVAIDLIPGAQVTGFAVSVTVADEIVIEHPNMIVEGVGPNGTFELRGLTTISIRFLK